MVREAGAPAGRAEAGQNAQYGWRWSERSESPKTINVFWKHQKEKRTVHFATLMDICHLEKKMRSYNQAPTLYLQNKVRLHLKGRPQMLWMSLQDNKIVQDKQPTQHQLTLK